jgi:hypothetical protein
VARATGRKGEGEFMGDADLEATWGQLKGKPNGNAIRKRDTDDGQRVAVERYDDEGKLVGRLVFDVDGAGNPRNLDTVTHSTLRRKGIASELYQRAERAGYRVLDVTPGKRSPDGEALRRGMAAKVSGHATRERSKARDALEAEQGTLRTAQRQVESDPDVQKAILVSRNMRDKTLKPWQRAYAQAEFEDLMTNPKVAGYVRRRQRLAQLDAELVDAKVDVDRRPLGVDPDEFPSALTNVDAGEDAARNPGKMSAGGPKVRPATGAKAATAKAKGEHVPVASSDGSRFVWKDTGEPVDLESLRRYAAERGEDPAFFNPLDRHSSADRTIGSPSAGEGMSIDPLLEPMGREHARAFGEKRTHIEEQLLIRERRQTLREYDGKVLGQFGLHGTDGQVVRTADQAQAQRWATVISGRSGQKHVALAHRAADGDTGGPREYVIVPEVIARRVYEQLERTPGRLEGLSDYAMRKFIRAALPFSTGWHLGNAVDLTTRLVVSLSPKEIGEGAKLAAALEKVLDDAQLPELKAQLTSSLVGHFGSRHTLEPPRFSQAMKSKRAKQLSDRVGDFWGALAGVRHWRKTTDRVFDFSRDIEAAVAKRALGAEAARYARELGHAVDDHVQLMKRLGDELARDPAKLHELQARTLEIIGDYATRSPAERRFMATVDPFWKWVRASTRFVARTAPENHPMKLALAVQVVQMTAEERAKVGLNFFLSDEAVKRLEDELGYAKRADGFFAGGIAIGDRRLNASQFTSVGEITGAIADPGDYLARKLNPPASTIAKALDSIDGKAGSKREPGADSRLGRAVGRGLETFVPGARQLKRGLEGGRQPMSDSTVLNPDAPGLARSAFDSAMEAIDPTRDEPIADQDMHSMRNLRLDKASQILVRRAKPGELIQVWFEGEDPGGDSNAAKEARSERRYEWVVKR